MSVGTSTEAGTVLEPHQVAVDNQMLRRLHQLTGALIGGTAPPPGMFPAESLPYTLPTVDRGDNKCPVCHQIFKTNHHLRHHMDIHKGTGYPYSKCHKSLSSRKMLRQDKKACKEGWHHVYDTCSKLYASAQILRQHVKVKHGAGCPELDEVFHCPHCQKDYGGEEDHVGASRGVPSEAGQERAILL